MVVSHGWLSQTLDHIDAADPADERIRAWRFADSPTMGAGVSVCAHTKPTPHCLTFQSLEPLQGCHER